MSGLGPGLVEEVGQLRKRAKKFSRWGIYEVVGGVIALVGAFAAYAVSRHVAPDVALSVVDVPAQLLARFSDAVSQSGSAGVYTSAFASLGAFITPVAQFIAVLGGIIGVGLAIFSGEPSRALFPVLASGMMLGATSLMGGIFGSDPSSNGDGGSPISARQAFVQALNNHDVRSAESMLAKYAGVNAALPSPTDDAHAALLTQVAYVRAQLALLSPVPWGPSTIRGVSDWMVQTMPHKTSFTPNGATAYAIDYAAYGAARSAPARLYYANAKSNQQAARGVSDALGGAAVLCFLIGAGLFGFGQSIKARVKRIEELAGLKQDESPSVDKALFSELSDDQREEVQHLFPLSDGAEHQFHYIVGADGHVLRRDKLPPAPDGHNIGRIEAKQGHA